ncbi:hypothetical protein SH467x_000100 [Pirellulaceae bacterium SH467]
MSKIKAILLLVPAALVLGCASTTSVDVVDLNKVLQALATVLDESAASSAATADAAITADAANSAEKADSAGGTAVTVAAANPSEENSGSPTNSDSQTNSNSAIEGTVATVPVQQDPAKEAEFLKRYAAELNKLQVMASPVGVAMAPGGEIIGFKDPNLNNIQDAGEAKEFTVTIDPDNQRLVASDNNGHHRPYGYRPGGFLTGYLIASMLNRQSGYYSGPNAGARPDFRGTTMSPNDYHKTAVSSARARASASSSSSSARMRTGSKGFSFGK